jgi:DNA-binding transcriptional LysR family regulator
LFGDYCGDLPQKREVILPMAKNDEKILAALLSAGSVRTAATAAGVSESTVRNRLKDSSFRAAYEAGKGELLQTATASMLTKLEEATATISDLMSDGDSPANLRLAAADSLLRHCLRYVATADIERRLAALEAAQDALEGEKA